MNQKITFPERKQEPAPLSLYDQIIKALQSLRPVYITDGTVTRLVTAVEYLSSEVRCTLDDRSRFSCIPVLMMIFPVNWDVWKLRRDFTWLPVGGLKNRVEDG